MSKRPSTHLEGWGRNKRSRPESGSDLALGHNALPPSQTGRNTAFFDNVLSREQNAATYDNAPDVQSFPDQMPTPLVLDKGTILGKHDEVAASTICLGMIADVHCKKLKSAKVDSIVVPDQDFIQLQHRNRNGRIILGISEHPRLLQVNAKVAAAMDHFLKHAGTSLQFYTTTQSLTRLCVQCSRKSNAANAEKISTQVNIYAPWESSFRLGTVLSEQEMFLQDPIWRDEDLVYENPQILEISGINDETWLDGLILSGMCFDSHARQGTDWSVALDDLPLHREETDAVVLGDRGPSEVLETQLMQHQEQARRFMSLRESGSLIDELKFWRLDRVENGVAVYRHVITAEEESTPQQEPLGGILADEMGLGKTLSTISLIATSLDRATRFANSGYGRQSLPLAKTTLVIVPSTQLMDVWVEEVQRHVAPRTLKFAKYYGHSRFKHLEELLQCDMVITTYGTVSTEHRRVERHILYYVKWFRVVLDEAHTIRSRTTQQFRAVMALNAQHHWCLSGTPIQNRLDDLGALLDFCRVPQLRDARVFQQHLVKVHRQSPSKGLRLTRETLSLLCLRRTKNLLDLSPPVMVEHKITFSAEERQKYNYIIQKHRAAMDSIISGKSKIKRVTPLELLLRLRIFCNQGTFMQWTDEGMALELDADETFTLLEEKEATCCEVCFSCINSVNQQENPRSGRMGMCSHVLCCDCYKDVSAQDSANNSYKCPVCDQTTSLQPLAIAQDTEGQIEGHAPHSSKLTRLIQDLVLTKDHEKSVVFSQWKKTLNIASRLCTAQGIAHIQIDGETPHAQRTKMLARFAEDPTISCLLMTSGTGAEGLNITAASRVHIVEPQWNPAVEAQAIARAIRIGQVKTATVIRYIVDNSVENYIQKMQTNKTELVRGGLGNAQSAQFGS